MKFNDRGPDRSALRTPSTYHRLWVFFGGRILGALLLTVVIVGPTVSHAEETVAASGAGGKTTPEITKLIPDTKVFLGSPPTTFDLSRVLSETEVAKGGGRLELKVVYNKDEQVATATVEDGRMLILTWGNKKGKSQVVVRVTNKETKKSRDYKFLVEVWYPNWIWLVLTVVGGLGIFLLGMKNMSEGLQAVAGAGLRRMISAVTDNRLLATGVGASVTMLIQSSSITTVMIVGFVNSGFMTLSQAIGVIMGANIGTTITAWILVLKIGVYGLPVIGFAAFIYLFSMRDRVRYVALAVMGLGMVFFGLELMKDGFSIVKDMPDFEEWFRLFAADSYWGVLKCAAVGCVLTFILQSSSATLGITISLAVTGVIRFETAAALVLGENIGTTITAWLASFGATVNAKRAAYFHIIFNVLGVLWITAIFRHVCLPLVETIIGISPGLEPGTEVAGNVTAGIALTHTLFNVTNTILFLPFVHVFARLLERIIPQRAEREKPHLTSLDVRMLETAGIAIEQSRVEVLRMAVGCKKLADWLKEIICQEIPDQKLVQKVFHREEVLDTIQDEIVAFMAQLLSGNIPHDVIDDARRQLRMADEYESVSDYLVSILKSHLKLEQSGLRFAEEDSAELLRLHDMVADYLGMISRSYEKRGPEVLGRAYSEGAAITASAKELRDQFLAKMSQQKFDPQIIVAYTAQLNSYRRVREHALNIAEALAGEK